MAKEYAPFKMRGNPMKRNFGIGASPAKREGVVDPDVAAARATERTTDKVIMKKGSPAKMTEEEFMAMSPEDRYKQQKRIYDAWVAGGKIGKEVVNPGKGPTFKKTGSPAKYGDHEEYQTHDTPEGVYKHFHPTSNSTAWFPGEGPPVDDDTGEAVTRKEEADTSPPKTGSPAKSNGVASRQPTRTVSKSPKGRIMARKLGSPAKKLTYKQQLARYNAWVAGGKMGKEVVNPNDPKSKVFQEGPGVKKTGSPAKWHRDKAHAKPSQGRGGRTKPIRGGDYYSGK